MKGDPLYKSKKTPKLRFCEQELIRKVSLKFYGNCLASKEVAWNEKASKEAALKEKVSKEAASRESATTGDGGFFNGCLYGVFY